MPDSTTGCDVVLWHLRVSHFNEKARWALDYKGIPHVRRDLVPGLHRLRARTLSKGWTAPVLVIDGEGIGDTTRIVAELERRFPDPPLYPADAAERRRALEIEDWFDEEVAHHLRRVVFDEMLRHPEVFDEFMMGSVRPSLRRLMKLTAPLAVPGIRRTYDISAETAEQGMERTREALDRVEAERGGRDYLVGDSFTVADLTAAAILSPLVAPPEFPYPLRIDLLPDAVRDFRASVETHPGFGWVREMFHRHRGASAEVGTREPVPA